VNKVTIIYSISSDRVLTEEEIMNCLQLKDDIGSSRKVELIDKTVIDVRCDGVVIE
jgi:hypothetical protein